MKIKLKNLGVFKQAEYELGDLTIICGENNTGKTYATYALFGFYDFWEKAFQIKSSDEDIAYLLETGTLTINLNTELNYLNSIIAEACNEYNLYLAKIFAAQSEYFKGAKFEIALDENDVFVLDTHNVTWSSSNDQRILQIVKIKDKKELYVSLLEGNKSKVSSAVIEIIHKAISMALKSVYFGSTFTKIFIASAERTGAVIFKNNLRISERMMIQEMELDDEVSEKKFIPLKYSSEFALPITRNISFIKGIESIQKNQSYIQREHPELLEDFSNIIGGQYKVIENEGLFYFPNSDKKIRLSMGESSSSVRSLLDVGFYLRHIAKKGDLLMIDEPELNLHPSNQRKLAKLFARLVKIGIKVFITTHSDYIIKELNTLIMLNANKDSEHSQEIAKKYGYKESELISADNIKVFISKKSQVLLEGQQKRKSIQTLVPAVIDEYYGIEAESFDQTINEMNEIQNAIILG